MRALKIALVRTDSHMQLSRIMQLTMSQSLYRAILNFVDGENLNSHELCAAIRHRVSKTNTNKKRPRRRVLPPHCHRRSRAALHPPLPSHWWIACSPVTNSGNWFRSTRHSTAELFNAQLYGAAY